MYFRNIRYVLMYVCVLCGNGSIFVGSIVVFVEYVFFIEYLVFKVMCLVV